MVSKALVCEIPKHLWESDFFVDLDNDIKFLEHHFQCNPEDFLWIRESCRLSVKGTDLGREVWVEYNDGQKRKTTLLPEQVEHPDRKVPPIAMYKAACRYVLRVKEIDSRWLDKDKRTKLVWVIGIERIADPDYLFEQERRGCLK